MRAMVRRAERGFSLIELMIAMLVTLIVSGAIYGLLASGQNAFRREPEVSDRQQNIRLAMDIITKDVSNAGANIPAFAQVFTNTDPSGTVLNGYTVTPFVGAMGPAAATLRGGDSTNADVLEMIEAEDRCPAQRVCTTGPAPGASGAFGTREPNPQCLTPQSFAILTDNVNMTIQPVKSLLPTACTVPNPGNTATNGGVDLDAARQVGSNPVAPAFAAPGGGVQAFLYAGRVVRYMIAPSASTSIDNWDATTPVLWRSVTGQYYVTATGTVISAAPGAPNSAWQMVARGIDDLQVEYMDGTGNWQNSPPAAIPCGAPDSCPNPGAFTPIVRQVRVTLSARTTAQGLAGQMNAPGTGPQAIRGQLVSVIQPRSALWALQMGGVVR